MDFEILDAELHEDGSLNEVLKSNKFGFSFMLNPAVLNPLKSDEC